MQNDRLYTTELVRGQGVWLFENLSDSISQGHGETSVAMRETFGGLRGGGTNRSDKGLNLRGSWQQGHSAPYNTPSRI